MALHALSKYGAATFTRAKKATQVTIHSSGAFSTKFQVNNDNQLLLQRVMLPTVPGYYTMKVTGEGCVYLQVRLGQRRGGLLGTILSIKSQNSGKQMDESEKEMRELRGVLRKGEEQTPVFNVPQTSLKYSVLPREEEFPFALVVRTMPETCEDPKAHTSFQISLNIR